MHLIWTSKALSDVGQLREFLGNVNKAAAERSVRKLAAAIGSLLSNPRIGEKLSQFDPREIRRVLVGPYEIRYEILNSEIYILRIWHTRQHR
jgi:plasmid stabilization system protein ParE